jgi:hypothetical protein
MLIEADNVFGLNTKKTFNLVNLKVIECDNIVYRDQQSNIYDRSNEK